MKDGKAPGEDGITTEMLKILEEFTIDKLTDLFNDIYNTGYLPEELAKSVYIPLPKKAKAVECGDHRTISLMPHVTKLLLKVIQERISHKVNKEIGETQFGFKPQSGTREAIFCLNHITQKHLQNNRKVYACFIDYAKAFDRVHHVEIINCLEKAGIDGKDIRLITNLYWHQKAAIKIQGEVSTYTNIKRGVRQGCVLSPYLFNLYTEFIFRETENISGVKIGGKKLNNLRYADDTVLLAENQADLQNITSQVKDNSEKMGLNMNVKKTKVMVMSRTPVEDGKIVIDGEALEEVTSFKYLGQNITTDGKTDDEIKTRIAVARLRFSELSNILTSQSTQLGTRIRLLKCYVHSVLLYGSETWTITKTSERKIKAFEMWTYRRMARISWKERKTNKEVCDALGLETNLLKEMKSRKLKYFGHVKRHTTILKEVMEGKVDGKRARGRPPRQWLDDIREWTGKSAKECTDLARDRNEWRSITSRPLPGDGT